MEFILLILSYRILISARFCPLCNLQKLVFSYWDSGTRFSQNAFHSLFQINCIRAHGCATYTTISLIFYSSIPRLLCFSTPLSSHSSIQIPHSAIPIILFYSSIPLSFHPSFHFSILRSERRIEKWTEDWRHWMESIQCLQSFVLPSPKIHSSILPILYPSVSLFFQSIIFSVFYSSILLFHSSTIPSPGHSFLYSSIPLSFHFSILSFARSGYPPDCRPVIHMYT